MKILWMIVITKKNISVSKIAFCLLYARINDEELLKLFTRTTRRCFKFEIKFSVNYNTKKH